MTRYVALLRGINVGRAKRVAMADLRTLVESIGYHDVRTLLNSGNVVFKTASGRANPGPRIEKALPVKLGVSARVTTLTAGELSRVVDENPFPEATSDASRFLVAFLSRPAGRRRLEPLLLRDWTPGAIALGRRVAYVWCPQGFLGSPLLDAVAKALGDAVTTRNWATVTKLLRLCSAP